jgi:hypothetical protein
MPIVTPPPVRGRQLDMPTAYPAAALQQPQSPASSPPRQPGSGMPPPRMGAAAHQGGVNRLRANLPPQKTTPYTPTRPSTFDPAQPNKMPNAQLNGAVYMDEVNQSERVMCRHFAAMVMAESDSGKSMSEILKKFSTIQGIKDAVNEYGGLDEVEAIHTEIANAPMGQKELVSNKKFGSYLAEKAKKLDQKMQTEKKEAKELIALHTKTHALTLEIQAKIEDDPANPNCGKSYFAVSVYDPNLTNNHTRVLKCTPKELERLDFVDILPKQLTVDYSNPEADAKTAYGSDFKHVVAISDNPEMNLDASKNNFISTEKEDIPDLVESLDLITRQGFHEAMYSMAKSSEKPATDAEKSVLAWNMSAARKFGKNIPFSYNLMAKRAMNGNQKEAFLAYGALLKANQNNFPKPDPKDSTDALFVAATNGDIEGIQLFKEVMHSLELSEKSIALINNSILKTLKHPYINPECTVELLNLRKSLDKSIDQKESIFFAKKMLDNLAKFESLVNSDVTQSLFDELKSFNLSPTVLLANLMKPEIPFEDEMGDLKNTTRLNVAVDLGNSAYVAEHLNLIVTLDHTNIDQTALAQYMGFESDGTSALQSAMEGGDSDIAQMILDKLTPCGVSPQNALNLLKPLLESYSEMAADGESNEVTISAIAMLQTEIKKQESLLN